MSFPLPDEAIYGTFCRRCGQKWAEMIGTHDCHLLDAPQGAIGPPGSTGSSPPMTAFPTMQTEDESIDLKVPEFYEGYRTAMIDMLDHVRKHGKDDLIKWTEAALFGVTKP